VILDLPTPNFDIDVWGTKLNAAVEQVADAVDAIRQLPDTTSVTSEYVLTVFVDPDTNVKSAQWRPAPAAPPPTTVTHADLPAGVALTVLETGGTYSAQSSRTDLPRIFIGVSDPAAFSREGDVWFQTP
jgi:hypothetical protein